MTKAIMDADPLQRTIMFDCSNHAGDHDACTIMATLCNVLVEATFLAGEEPALYDKGHVRIDISGADDNTLHLFNAVWNVMKQAAEQQPDYIKLY